MSDKSAKSDVLLAKIAARQHGAISFRQLRSIGFNRDAVLYKRRVGRLHRVHQGVYAVGHAHLSPEGRWMAAVLACGHGIVHREEGTVLGQWGATVSHRSAAELWKLLPLREGPVHVSIPSVAGRRERQGICIFRSSTLTSAFATLRQGVPVTNPARTIADLRRVAGRRGRHGISPQELRRAIRQANVLGLKIDAESRRDRTRSDLERDFLRLCRRHRLPPPEVNASVGRYLVDFLWPAYRLIVEADGYRYHRGRVAFEDDHERDLRLRAMGYDVLRVSDKQLDEAPGEVAAVLRAALL